MKIAMLFDGASALGVIPDVSILETVEAVENALAVDHHDCVRVPVNPDARWIERMRRGKFDLAFNLCEGIDGLGIFEPAVISVLDLLGIPYTGASAWSTAICLRKHQVNAGLARLGLPVPPFAVVRPGDTIPSVGFPAICKPAEEDASLGVEQRSVVRTMRALGARVTAMHERWNEVLIQRYVDGREVNVGIVGDRVLPIAEINFGAMPRGMWRIVTYRSKWEEGSDEDLGAQPSCPAELTPDLEAELARIAMEAWRAVGGNGYGRVDFRIDRAGRPWLLEVNANPDFAPSAGLARMARAGGMEYVDLVRELCTLALYDRGACAPDRWAVAWRLSGIPDAVALAAVGER